MLQTTLLLLTTVLATLSLSQNTTTTEIPSNITVPSTCTGNYTSGTDTVFYTIPYTYTQVLSIIGNFSNFTWSGVPTSPLPLNGTDNTPGTARTYELEGAHVVETIDYYSKPPAPGPYVEYHSLAPLTVPAAGNVGLYAPYDGMTVESVCDGKASTFNFTVNYCATNATLGGSILRMIHLNSAITVGEFLGGRNFTGCEALGSNAMGPGNATATFGGGGMNGTSSGGSATPSSSESGRPSTGDAARFGMGVIGSVAVVGLGMMML